jgi:uncharacterized protein DUF955
MAERSLLEQARLSDPSASDADLVARIAAGTIAELGEQPPVRLDVVASYRDIAEIRVDAMQAAGSLGPEGGRWVMRLRAADPRRRRRFSGFHEIGHTFQPGYCERRHFRCAHPTPSLGCRVDVEALADIAAAHLLLPTAYFRADVAAHKFGLDAVIALANRYDASIQATARRFAELWPEPVLLLSLEMGVRKAERDDPTAMPRLRVVSAVANGCWPYVPPNKSAHPDGALVRALEGEEVAEAASLAELGLHTPGRLELSARGFSYSDTTGRPRRRVLALYRCRSAKRRRTARQMRSKRRG